MDNTVQMFLELRDKYWEKDGTAVIFIKHILVYFYEYRNKLNGSENCIVIPGKYDLVTADKILFELGYRRYSINYISKGVYPCDSTQIVFHNTL